MQDECKNGKNQKNKLLAFALTDAKWIDQFMLRDSSRGRIGSSGRRMSAHECFLQLLFASIRESRLTFDTLANWSCDSARGMDGVCS
jgi:hypothetical protein